MLGLKTRYRMADQECKVIRADDESVVVSSLDPLWAATPGQSAVFYDGEVCLGGAIIDTSR